MQIRLTGNISDSESIEVEVSYEDYGQTPYPAKVEEIIFDLANKLARKLVAARVA